MNTTVPSFAPVTEKPSSFNPVATGNPQVSRGSSITVGAELSTEFDTSTVLSTYLEVYINLLDAVNNQDFLTAKQQLSHFKRALMSQLTESFHHDLVEMGGKILSLLNRYDDRSIDNESMAALVVDLTEVGNVLMAA